uniref:hypothetical protein n=2 Tax=Bacteroides acidifaciens TaxID=85831 RepID=UPI001F5AC324
NTLRAKVTLRVLSCPALIAEATMNKGFEEIYEGMRVNRENFCLECVFSSEIELVHFSTVLNETARKETNFWCNYPN